MKYLLLFAVLALVYALARRQRRRCPPAGLSAAPPYPVARPALMVVCAHCGVHVPQMQACWRGSRSYCCRAHRDLDAST